MFILGKRLPIFSLIASILLIMVIKGNKPILTIILFVLLLYPFYSFLLFESATAYFQSDLFTMFFQRNEDLIDIENNPRLARIIAATEFFNKFELINIFYYPKEIILSSSEAHNHFHNLILQLYYEKGLISIIAIIVMSIKLLWIAPRKAMIINGIMLPLLFYFFMIGTSESLFLHRSSTESFIMIFIVIGYGIARKINSLKLHS
jgi:O-antigen ligase